jgi:DNA modification methylase
MQRTKSLGLLHKQLLKDSAMSRVGSAEYVLIFRKAGKNPKPISHDRESYPVDLWQKDASPVWMDVNQTRVLNKEAAKDNRDEKHICPLQLDVIERCLRLWSNPGDLVFSPFTGIGSEGFCSVKAKRRFIGAELKESYFKQAIKNLKNAESEAETLFEMAA